MSEASLLPLPTFLFPRDNLSNMTNKITVGFIFFFGRPCDDGGSGG
jgi:hypothetical protein